MQTPAYKWLSGKRGWMEKKICSGIRLDCGITMVSDKTRSNKLKRYKASDNREFDREFMDLVLFQSSNWSKKRTATCVFFFFYTPQRLQRLLERKRDYRRRSKRAYKWLRGCTYRTAILDGVVERLVGGRLSIEREDKYSWDRQPPAKGQVMRDIIRIGRQSVLITLFSSSTFVSYVPVS